MAEIKESIPLAPVQPVNPGRAPAQKRKPPRREEGHVGNEQRKHEGDSGSGHLLDEYV